MSTSTLPDAASLEHLMNQAKALYKAVTSGDDESVSRVRTHHPRPIDSPSLADCQLVLAREYGFDSWPKLKAHVDDLEYQRIVEDFKKAVQDSQADTVAALLKKSAKLRHHIDAPLFHFDTPAIVLAAGRNDRAMIDVLVDAGANVNVRTQWEPGGFGALDNASTETVAYLISRGAYVDIHAAAKHGMIDRVRELVEADPALVNSRGGDGQTPLHFASTIEICAYLIEHGADLNIRDIDHNATAAQYSIKDAEKVRYLVDRGAEADIFIACRLGDKKLTANILAKHSDALRWRLNHPLYHGLGGHIYLYIFGMSARPITIAVDHADPEYLHYLIDQSTPVDRLLIGCAMADRAIVDAALGESPDLLTTLTADDRAFISDAAWDNRIDAIRTMLDAGWEIDARGFEDSTALNRAAVRGWAPLVQLLIDRGASVEAKNVHGGWPLTAAIWGSENWPRATGDHPACVEALVAAGSKMPQALYGSPEVQEVLKRHGVGNASQHA